MDLPDARDLDDLFVYIRYRNTICIVTFRGDKNDPTTEFRFETSRTVGNYRRILIKHTLTQMQIVLGGTAAKASRLRNIEWLLGEIRNELDHSRFGFVVSKRLGKAVQRNKIKRRMREAARLRLLKIKPGFDLVFIARKPIAEVCYAEIEHTLEYLLRKADLFR